MKPTGDFSRLLLFIDDCYLALVLSYRKNLTQTVDHISASGKAINWYAIMFSNSCKYAIRAVLYLATSTDDEKKMKVDDIAEALAIPKHFLAKLLMQLTKHQIVSSLKGRNGGFYLTKKDRQRTLLDVVEAIDGSSKMRECVLGLDNCSDQRPCPYHFTVGEFKNKFYAQLRDETIEKCSKRIEEWELKLINTR